VPGRGDRRRAAAGRAAAEPRRPAGARHRVGGRQAAPLAP